MPYKMRNVQLLFNVTNTGVMALIYVYDIYLSPPWKYEWIGLGNVGTDLVDLRPSIS